MRMFINKAVILFFLYIFFLSQGIIAFCEEARTELEFHGYGDIILVGILMHNGERATCFRVPDGRLYIGKVGDVVGNYRGVIKSISDNFIRISQMILINGDEWVEINFKWPVSSTPNNQDIRQCHVTSGGYN